MDVLIVGGARALTLLRAGSHSCAAGTDEPRGVPTHGGCTQRHGVGKRLSRTARGLYSRAHETQEMRVDVWMVGGEWVLP